MKKISKSKRQAKTKKISTQKRKISSQQEILKAIKNLTLEVKKLNQKKYHRLIKNCPADMHRWECPICCNIQFTFKKSPVYATIPECKKCKVPLKLAEEYHKIEI